MSPPILLALSLILSVVSAALGWAAARAMEAKVIDPGVRERAWAAALYAPVLPPLIVGLMLLAPAPVAPSLALSGGGSAITAVSEVQVVADIPLLVHGDSLAVAALILAGLLAGARALVLAARTARLRGLVRATTPGTPELCEALAETARRIGAPVPDVTVCGSGAEAFLTGLRRPLLVLPAALAAEPEGSLTRAVCAHELAHLKRRDHHALWLEEVLLTVLAINPLLPVIRDHRAAAREEACDATALAGAREDSRRQYSRALLDALQNPVLRDRAPALTFTSTRRTFVMHRLKAILSPASPAGSRSRLAVAGMGALVAAVACAGSVAVAAQREPVAASPAAEAVSAPASPRATVGSVTMAAQREPMAASPAAEALGAPATPQAAVGSVTMAAQREPMAAGPVAEAPGAPAAPQAVITNPSWAQSPIPPMYPAAAAQAGAEGGEVVLSCTAEPDGRMSDCTVVRETPEGLGFGAAALEGARGARLSPRTIDDNVARATVRFTIRFRLADPA